MTGRIIILVYLLLGATALWGQMEIEWERNYGRDKNDLASYIQQTSDGGFVVVGHSVTAGQVAMYDCWIIKLNVSGDLEWEKTYGGSSGEIGHSIRQTSDGGYIIAADTHSSDQDVGGNNGEMDFWLLKLKPIDLFLLSIISSNPDIL